MAARRKDKPMKYWGFYCPIELKAETIKCAEQLDKSDSEYIRLAVEHYNTHNQQDNMSATESAYKTFIYNGPVEYAKLEPIETIKMPKQSKTIVQSFGKGGK